MARIEVSKEEFFCADNAIRLEEIKHNGFIYDNLASPLMPTAAGEVFLQYFDTYYSHPCKERARELFQNGRLEITFEVSTIRHYQHNDYKYENVNESWDKFRSILKKTGYLDAHAEYQELIAKLPEMIKKKFAKSIAAKKAKTSDRLDRMIKVTVPYELKDSFKKGNPKATWNPGEKVWMVPEVEAGALASWRWANEAIDGKCLGPYENPAINVANDAVFARIELDLRGRVAAINYLKTKMQEHDVASPGLGM